MAPLHRALLLSLLLVLHLCGARTQFFADTGAKLMPRVRRTQLPDHAAEQVMAMDPVTGNIMYLAPVAITERGARVFVENV